VRQVAWFGNIIAHSISSVNLPTFVVVYSFQTEREERMYLFMYGYIYEYMSIYVSVYIS
jgi:hypothetical protein